jgi:drug/metabolite transporter (DMT)-like permease
VRLLGRLISAVTTIVVAIIVIGIVLVLLEANPHNDLVNAVLDAGRWLVQPFKGVFHPGSLKGRVAANWGLAAIVYGLVGGAISRLLIRR